MPGSQCVHMTKKRLLIFFLVLVLMLVLLLFLSVCFWNDHIIGPGVRVSVSQSSWYYIFVARGMLSRIRLDSADPLPTSPGLAFFNRFEYLTREKVRVLHAALGVDLCRSIRPRGFYHFPPQTYGGNPLTHFNHTVKIAAPGNILAVHYTGLPLWIPLALLLILEIGILREPWLRYSRRRRNCCVHCGYNLTGNVSGICSECGQVYG